MRMLREAWGLVLLVILPSALVFAGTTFLFEPIFGVRAAVEQPNQIIAEVRIPPSINDVANTQFPELTALEGGTLGWAIVERFDAESNPALRRYQESARQRRELVQTLEAAVRPATSTIEIDQQMRMGETYEATLIIERGSGEATLAIAERTSQPTAAEVPIQVTDQVYASATSAHLRIEPTSPAWQSLGAGSAAVWTWIVEPLRSGDGLITFSLYHKLLVDGVEQTVYVENYPQSLVINVPFWSRVSNALAAFFSGPIGWLASLSGAITGVVGFRKWWAERASRAAEVTTPESETAS